MNAEELAKLFHTAYENNFSKHVKTVQKEVLSWEDMPESYHNHMIASANQVIEDLYGDGWRLVRLREWLGAYLVNDEVRRKVQP